ncbi:MAG: endonuclease/exonuclease/phosphatase family protein [Oscillospiraceae bacterium]|nr:endonuclease/exonuclease/phosphatase family protein [Oscillospiraceae bacterium]
MKKNVKWLMSVILCTVLFCAVFNIAAFAEDTAETGTLNLISFNVSGLPIIGTFQGDARSSGNKKSAVIGEYINGLGLDIVGVQEDFNYHKGLAGKMTAYPYKTVHSGGVPGGDGLNIFSKRGIYNVERVEWDVSYGVLYDGTDRLAPKGFVYSVAELADGVYIDLYVLHANAGTTIGSIEARADNYRQLAEHISALEYDRPIIMLGDFNSILGRDRGDALYENLLAPAGLTDVWAEMFNDGNCEYDGGSGWNPTYGERVDRVLYKNGGGVAFTPETFEYIMMADENGKTHTDHMAALASLSYTVTDPPENTEELITEEPIGVFEMFTKQFKAVFKTLFLIFTNLHELYYLISGT